MANEQTKKDISISGSGNFAGGEYGSVSISGSGKGTGDVVCESFKASGSGRVEGSLTCISCQTSGSAHISGDLRAEDGLFVSGSQHVDGSVEADSVKIAGSAHVGQDITAQNLKVSGSLVAGGDCRAANAKISGSIKVEKGMEGEDILISGGFRIAELLNAGRLEVHVGGGCSCGEIGGDEIIVTDDPKSDFLITAIARLFGKRSHHRLTTGTIEGNRISLECTDAEVVRGQDIVIGKNCKIGRVEYSGTLEILENAEVGEQVKI